MDDDVIHLGEQDDDPMEVVVGRPSPMVLLPRAALQDNRLSMLARGILMILLSQPPGSRWTPATLPGWVPTADETIEDIQEAWAELVAVGYVTPDGVVDVPIG